MTDLLLRLAAESRSGAVGRDDYDVIVDDGFVIGRIFKATASPAGKPWRWTLAYGQREDRTPTRRRARPRCMHSPRAGGGK
jgi:hypothetical protein